MSLTKLIKQLKEKNSQLNQSEIEAFVDIFLNEISNALKNGINVEIRGLGIWYNKRLKENYNARNPATNKLIYKPERVKVRFRPAKKLKEIINE